VSNSAASGWHPIVHLSKKIIVDKGERDSRPRMTLSERSDLESIGMAQESRSR
jgi:hypothetical protein